MEKPKISIVCAISKNRVIGKNNDLIFKIPEDLKHFKELTMGHPIIMGRNTFESIGKPLPGRYNIVITSDENYVKDGIVVVNSLDFAINFAQSLNTDEIFIIGGGRVFADSIDLADKLYLTIVDKEAKGDVFFPDYSEFKKVISEESRESNGYKFKFVVLEK